MPDHNAGPALIAITATHGFHRLVVPAFGVWLLGMIGCAAAAVS